MQAPHFQLFVIDSHSSIIDETLKLGLQAFSYQPTFIPLSNINELSQHTSKQQPTVFLIDLDALQNTQGAALQQAREKLGHSACRFIAYAREHCSTSAAMAFDYGADDCFSLSSPIAELCARINHQLVELSRSTSNRPAVKSKPTDTLYKTDSLTGASTRKHFYALLDDVSNNNDSISRAIIYIDVARFHEINNSYGSSTADNLLRLICARIKRQLHSSGKLSRLGSDEFAVIIDEDKHNSLVIALENLAVDLQRPFVIGTHRYHVDFAIAGIHIEKNTRSNDLLDKVLHTVQSVKLDPSCDWAIHQEDNNNINKNRQAIADQFIENIEENKNVELHYQPLIDLKHYRIIGAEALLRWKKNGVTIPPLRFLPAIENIRASQEVGLWILKRATRDAQHWASCGLKDCIVSVNVFPTHLESGHLVEHVKTALAYSGLPSSMLTLEVTESRLIEHFERCREQMNKISELGVDFALDDFGTGYSSLSYLHKLSFSKLKIDKIFVQNLQQNDSKILVESILYFAKKMGLVVVAEGIETRQHELDLSGMHCPIGQGYLYGKPMPRDEFIQWCEQWNGKERHKKGTHINEAQLYAQKHTGIKPNNHSNPSPN